MIFKAQFCKTLASVAFYLFLACYPPKLNAASILRYYDADIGSSVLGALAQLGATATATRHSGFFDDLSSQSWDLVVVHISSDLIPPENVTALVDYVNGGGRAILSYWDLDSSMELATAFEGSVASSFSSPQPIHAWSPHHELFSTPYSVVTPVTFIENVLFDNGDELYPIGGGRVIAGFVPTPSAGKGAIIIGNGGRTILNGWAFDELRHSNGENLVANEIRFALNSVPEPSLVNLFMGFALFSGVFLRSRNLTQN